MNHDNKIPTEEEEVIADLRETVRELRRMLSLEKSQVNKLHNELAYTTYNEERFNNMRKVLLVMRDRFLNMPLIDMSPDDYRLHEDVRAALL